MKAFVIPVGTKIKAVKKSQPQDFQWHLMEEHVTTKQHMFFVEDIAIDPVGKVGTHRGYISTIGGTIAKAGWYGFSLPEEHPYYMMLVPVDMVEVH